MWLTLFTFRRDSSGSGDGGNDSGRRKCATKLVLTSRLWPCPLLIVLGHVIHVATILRLASSSNLLPPQIVFRFFFSAFCFLSSPSSSVAIDVVRVGQARLVVALLDGLQVLELDRHVMI